MVVERNGKRQGGLIHGVIGRSGEPVDRRGRRFDYLSDSSDPQWPV
jgi:hypothetical protein